MDHQQNQYPPVPPAQPAPQNVYCPPVAPSQAPVVPAAPAQNVYVCPTEPVVQKKRGGGVFAIVGMSLSIISILISISVLEAFLNRLLSGLTAEYLVSEASALFVFSTLALVFSCVGKARSSQSGSAVVGLVLSIVSLSFFILAILILFF